MALKPTKTKATEQRRALPPLDLRASFQPATVDPEKRTAEIVWTTGARVLRNGWDGRFYEELSTEPKSVRMDRLNNGAPFLNAHNAYDLHDVIGVVESATLKGGEGRAIVRFSERDEVAPIFADVKAGILRNVSVGYRVHKLEQVEGGDDEIPVYRAVDWEPYEISAVPMGADAGAGFRADEKTARNECVVITREGEKGVMQKFWRTNADGTRSEIEKAEDGTETVLRTLPAEAPKPAPVDPAAAEAARQSAIAEGVRAESERQGGIRAALAAARMTDAEFERELIGVHGDPAKKGVSLDEARKRILDKLAAASDASKPNGHIRITDDAADKWQRGAASWVMAKAGLAEIMRSASKNAPAGHVLHGIDLDPGEFRGLTMLDLARESLERQGVKTRGMDKMRLVGQAFTHRAGGYNTTSDFGVLMENTMHKVLMASYAITPDTWRRFCKVGSVSDFRAHNRYMLGSFGTLDTVPEHGEFKNKSIPDGEKQSISIGTKGNIIALSRQAIINDDLGAFNSLATAWGRTAALSIEVDVYTTLALNAGLGPLLSDGNPIFHARTNADNISAGAALSAAAIDADRQKMASMKDISGNEFLGLLPAVLLVPLSLGSTGRTINSAEYDPDTVANKSQNKPNVVRGLFRDVADTPRLTGTRRYLFADPAIAPVLEVAFLDGAQEPFLENQEGWRIDGTEWKVRLDYGVGGVGYHGAVTNAGA